MKTNPLQSVSDKELWDEWQKADTAANQAANQGKDRGARSFSKRAWELEREWFRRYPLVVPEGPTLRGRVGLK